MDYNVLLELLRGHKVYLQTHNFPDPDAISSAYGMQVFLKKHGIDSSICYAGEVEKISTKRMFDTFGIDAKCITEIPDMTPDDYIVTIDAQKYNSNITDFCGNEVACIDHHPTKIKCNYQYSDIRICGACASIVADYFIQSGTELDSNTATCLLYGLKMDTDSFNRGVTRLDIDVYGHLYKIADNQIIASLYKNTMELDDLHAYGEAIKNIKVYDNIGFTKISFDCPDALVAMISDFILCLDVVEFAVVYATRNGGLKFSVRNEHEILHAGDITFAAMKRLGGGGGGHYAMAGGTLVAEKLEALGDNPDHEIRARFMDAIDAMREQYLE